MARLSTSLMRRSSSSTSSSRQPGRAASARRSCRSLTSPRLATACISIRVCSVRRDATLSRPPTQASWGLDNRLVAVRSVVDHGEATRLECRWASADANPYLVMAGCLAAGADGLAKSFDVPPMVTGDPHVDASLTRLPTDLAGAIPAFEQSQFVRDLYGDVFVDVYSVMLRHELELFARHVSDWERERYREVM